MTAIKKQVRDPATGQFAFDGDFGRVCSCGHPLGAHLHGGWDCGVTPNAYPESRDCQCVRFHPKRIGSKPSLRS